MAESSLCWCRFVDVTYYCVLQEAEEAAEAALNRAASGRRDDGNGEMANSPSEYSFHSSETFVGQKGIDEKEKMSIRSEGGESINEAKAKAKGRKVGKQPFQQFVTRII